MSASDDREHDGSGRRPVPRELRLEDLGATPSTTEREGLGEIADEVAARRDAGAERVQTALAWFPAGEWEVALGRWPDLGDYNPVDHHGYCRALEGRAKALARRLGEAPLISPILIDELDRYAADAGIDAGSGRARAALAAEVARTNRARVWPPGRNEPCWCGSGAKYKQCCADAPEAEA